MNNFVTRMPSWQTVTYTSTLNRSRKEPQNMNKNLKKKPLRESQLQQRGINLSPSLQNNRRLSIRDEHLLKIFASKPDQPLVPSNEDSGLSSSSHCSFDHFNVDINQLLLVEKHNLCELSDYVSSPDDMLQQEKFLISQSPPVTFNEVIYEDIENNRTGITADTPNSNIEYITNTQINTNTSTKEPTKQTTLSKNPQMARIQRDLNSPSASLRVRAIRALKNPINGDYTNFDIPHEEQNIISLEEYQPSPPPSIEELMHDIVVYVEVRTGEDNRSEGVKKVISQLGARVNDKLLRGTTHVIFKDGLLSTYKKAKNWNIPVVSILWIEACKKKRMICDPNEFPISNIDRYENPELYEKMKRHKSMQPDSECNKRIRLRQGTPKDSTPKAVTVPKTPSAINNTPKSSRKQSDISQYFKKLTNANSTPMTDNNSLPGSTISITKSDFPESPATQLLNRIESNSFTPLQPRKFQSAANSTTLEVVMSLKPSNSGDVSEQTIVSTESRKNLEFIPSESRSAKKKVVPSPSPKKRIPHRRTSVQMPLAQSTSAYSLQLTETDTSGRVTRRRSSIHTAVNMSLSTIDPNTPDSRSNVNYTTFSPIHEENRKGATMSNVNKASNQQIPRGDKTRLRGRRTIFSYKTPEISPQKKTKTPSRRTLYTPKTIEESISELAIIKTNESSKVLDESLLRFALTPTTILDSKGSSQENLNKNDGSLLEDHSSTMVFSSTRLPSTNRRRTLFDVSMDIIQQRLHNINNSAKRSVAKELTSHDQSPNIVSSKTNIDSAVAKNPSKIDGESSSQVTPTAPTPESMISTPKAVTKRKLFVPNDTSLILSANPPGSVKKSPNEARVKRRRTITTQPKEKRVMTKSRNNITVNTKSRSEVIIPPSSIGQVSNLTKSVAQLVPMLGNELADSENGETSKKSYTSLPATAVNGKINGSSTTINATNAANAPVSQTFLKNEAHVMTAAPLPKLKGSFMSIISSNTSDNTVKQQLQQDMGVDENIAINTPSLTTVLSQASTTPSIATENPKMPSTSGSTMLLTNQTAPKVVKKSQMSEIPDKAKDAVEVGASGCTLISKNALGGNKKWPYIVCTNMHREQIKVMREAIAELGGLQLNHCVNDDTTHLVSYEPRRTLNLLRGLIRGLWILDYKWVLDSLKAGCWLNEEEYELRVFSRAIEICRTERQAFGNTYKCELFADLGTFYISSRCGPISKENLKELIELCGGKVVDHRKRAKYILGDPHKTLEDKVYVTPFWVLDSITHMQVMRQQKYTYVTNTVVKPQPQLLQVNVEPAVSSPPVASGSAFINNT
ncbi:microcephalin isoform X1 [Bactrocera oleae]|uniref:microcephalin isoform X1 n=1 Tax=Bactrocera oleae TaxID=104688 RepID=UPI00387EAF05